MGFFALEEWGAANRDYENTPAPHWHVKSVPDGFTAISWNPLVYLLHLDGQQGFQRSFLRNASSLSLLEHYLGSSLRVCLRPRPPKPGCLRAMDGCRCGPLLRSSSIGPVCLEAVTIGGAASRGYNRGRMCDLYVAALGDRGDIYPEHWATGRVHDGMAYAGPYQSQLDCAATLARKYPWSLLGNLVSG